jgi:hypothetical protein
MQNECFGMGQVVKGGALYYNESMKKFPIGVQTFSKLIEGYYIYVDKTEDIYRLLTEGGQYYFLSRPRRFGKSLLISTLREIFSGHRELFKGLWIYDQIEWETHPVIYIDFLKISHDTPQNLQRSLAKTIRKIGGEYDVILDPESDYKDVFAELIETLARKYRQKVVILIDEYDKPIIDQIEDRNVAVANRNILRTFYEVIKGTDEFNRFGFITGVSKFSRVSVFSGLNNLRDITLSHPFSTLLGYTEDELRDYFAESIEAISRKKGMRKDQLAGNIKEWYNGYSWDGIHFVYNPHSILMLFQEEKFDNYWFTSGTPSFLINIMKEKHKDIRDYENITAGSYVFESYDLDTPHIEIASLLFQTGYLTIREIRPINETEVEYILSYPNKEVRHSIVRYLLRAYTGKEFTEGAEIIRRLAEALNKGECPLFFDVLKSLFASISYNIFINNEAYYHSIIYMVLKLTGAWVQTEVQTNKGRMDAVLETEKAIFIMEFKLGPADEALKQIKEKRYYEKYLASPKSIKLIGVGIDLAERNIGDYLLEELSK